jgi:hypothetical protein
LAVGSDEDTGVIPHQRIGKFVVLGIGVFHIADGTIRRRGERRYAFIALAAYAAGIPQPYSRRSWFSTRD